MDDLYQRILAAPRPTSPARAPRPSAAVVLWRHSREGLEVFWVQRSPALPFMGGWHAFPGGALDAADTEVPLAGRPEGLDEVPPEAGFPAGRLEAPEGLGPIDLPGLAAAALRELFEETGVLPLAGGHARGSDLPAALAAARRGLLARPALPPGGFGELVRALELRLDATGLRFAGRWLTPPLSPIRFDNRFFLLEWGEAEPLQPEVLPGELASGAWIRPEAALAAWRHGGVITSPPILHLLRVLAEVGPEAGLARLRVPDEANLGPLRRIEFRPGVILLPLPAPTLPPATHTNSFLLGLDRVVLVDPGSPGATEVDALEAVVADARLRLGKRLEAIWLTHHHPDHVGGAAELRRRLGVPIAAHEETARRLAPQGLEVDLTLTDGQVVALGGEEPFPVRVVHTPGHARGHLCFYDELGGSLLAGDLVASVGTIVIDPPEGDMTEYLDSLERVIQLAPLTLFPAHGSAIRDAVGKLAQYRSHRITREENVLAAWTAGRHSPEAIVAAVYEDLPAPSRPLAARQVQAHLDRLRATGRL